MKKFLLLSLFTASVANAQTNWTPIAESSSKPGLPVIGVDYSRSIFTNQMPVIFWNDFTANDLRSKQRPDNIPMYIYRTKIDCKNRLLQNEYSLPVEVKHFYDPRPQQFSSAWTGPGKWYVPDIGSAQEFLMNHFCK
jgi:hypothetical protein